MKLEPLTLESKFEVTKFALYLKRHPEHSCGMAIKNFEDFLALVHAYKKLHQRYNSLETEHLELIEILANIPEPDFLPDRTKN